MPAMSVVKYVDRFAPASTAGEFAGIVYVLVSSGLEEMLFAS